MKCEVVDKLVIKKVLTDIRETIILSLGIPHP
jgi:hypothetical protein